MFGKGNRGARGAQSLGKVTMRALSELANLAGPRTRSSFEPSTDKAIRWSD